MGMEVQDCMSETMSAPAGGSAADSAPGSVAAGDAGQTGALDTGNAPGGDPGVGAGEGSAPFDAAVAPPAKFRFRGREWDSPAHAENAVESMIGKLPSVQRENVALTRRLAEMESELQALHALGIDPNAMPAGREEKRAEALHDKLAKSGDLDFIAQLAEDPNVGLKGALYEYTRLMEERQQAQFQQFLEQNIQPMIVQRDSEQAFTGVSRALREISQAFPELDPANESEEAQQAQAVILPMVRELFKPEALAQNPNAVLGLCALAYRESYGMPVIGQPPGSSGSPSAFAAEAAEAAASGPLPLDGSGVPRPGNGVNSPEERIRRENRALNSKVFRTPKGRPLGFSIGD